MVCGSIQATENILSQALIGVLPLKGIGNVSPLLQQNVMAGFAAFSVERHQILQLHVPAAVDLSSSMGLTSAQLHSLSHFTCMG